MVEARVHSYCCDYGESLLKKKKKKKTRQGSDPPELKDLPIICNKACGWTSKFIIPSWIDYV